MSSILTNNSAMVALQTLGSINKNLAMTQNEISTGLSIANAKDNSAVWAIAQTMRSDVSGFAAINDSLSLGSSSVAVARNAAESISDLLGDMKELVVAAQGQNVDRTKLQTDIEALTDQIESISTSAQFNGLNLLQSGSDVNVLSSLDRVGSAAPTASNITVQRQDLSISTTTTPATFGATGVTDSSIMSNNTAADGSGTETAAGSTATLGDGATQYIDIVSTGDGYSFRLTLDDTAATDTLGSRTFEYVANADDSADGVAAELFTQLSNFLAGSGTTEYSVVRSGNEIAITNNSGGNVAITTTTATGGTAGTGSGGLGDLADIDVTSDAGAAAALTTVETAIGRAIDAAAAFGSVQSRIEIQQEFVGSLSDSLKSGIGSLVDANMEEASARLQALQVQQQLGIQSLSIANQSPQNVLALFR